jgi:hypothetical protein
VRVRVDACTRVTNVRPGDKPRGSACSFRASSVRRPAHGPAPTRHRSAKAKAGRPDSSARSTAAPETHEVTHQLEDILWARLAVVVKLPCATQSQTPSDRQTVSGPALHPPRRRAQAQACPLLPRPNSPGPTTRGSPAASSSFFSPFFSSLFGGILAPLPPPGPHSG